MDLFREILKEDSIEKQNLYYNHLGFGWAMLTEDVRLRNYAFIKNGYTIPYTLTYLFQRILDLMEVE